MAQESDIDPDARGPTCSLRVKELQDLNYWAWSIIANSIEWNDPEWVEAAIKWRDAFHSTLGD